LLGDGLYGFVEFARLDVVGDMDGLGRARGGERGRQEQAGKEQRDSGSHDLSPFKKSLTLI
jgi:hypothetical protein